LKRRLDAGSYAAVAMTHVDTSTGTAAPIEAYCELLRGRDELRLLDGVCATAGMEERFDDWGLDALLTGAQKAMGTPPGVAILLVSERGMARREARSSVPAYSADLLRWAPIMENPGLYFSTPPVNTIVALGEAMKIILEEGMAARFARHARIAKMIRDRIASLGLGLFTSEDHLADTLSVVRYPEAVDDAKFRAEMAAEGVIVAGALGPIAGQAFRLGHMGNIGTPEVTRALEAIEACLVRSK
jgi:aspartate aminotransferase-like enzyme